MPARRPLAVRSSFEAAHVGARLRQQEHLDGDVVLEVGFAQERPHVAPGGLFDHGLELLGHDALESPPNVLDAVRLAALDQRPLGQSERLFEDDRQQIAVGVDLRLRRTAPVVRAVETHELRGDRCAGLSVNRHRHPRLPNIGSENPMGKRPQAYSNSPTASRALDWSPVQTNWRFPTPCSNSVTRPKGVSAAAPLPVPRRRRVPRTSTAPLCSVARSMSNRASAKESRMSAQSLRTSTWPW